MSKRFKRLLTLGIALVIMMTMLGTFAECFHIKHLPFFFFDIEKAFASKSSSKPEIDAGDWKYKLVNMNNPLGGDYDVELLETRDGCFFDARAVGELEAMLDKGREEGMELALVSGYRSYEYQKGLHERRIERLVGEGYSYEDAVSTAPTIVARPGESEHNIGLAVDIVSQSYPVLNSGFADTAEGRWLSANCAQFGFILRYEAEKQPITGVIYEPWHFRYVGREAAEYIMAEGICLEEFLLN